jgi:hypothetical protein
MIGARLMRNWGSIAQATAIAVALCFGGADISGSGVFVTPAAAISERDFTEDDVKTAFSGNLQNIPPASAEQGRMSLSMCS